MPQKRTRTVLSPEEKKVVIRIKTDNPKLKLNDIAEEFYKQTKKVISVTTVCNIWNNRKAIMDGIPYKTKKPAQDVSISQETIKWDFTIYISCLRCAWFNQLSSWRRKWCWNTSWTRRSISSLPPGLRRFSRERLMTSPF